MSFAIMEQLYFRPVTCKVWHCGPLDSVRLTLYLELWLQNGIRFFWCKLHWLGANCFKVIYLFVYICSCTCIHLSISPHTVSLPQFFPSMSPLHSCASMVRCKFFGVKYGITTIASRLGTINFSLNLTCVVWYDLHFYATIFSWVLLFCQHFGLLQIVILPSHHKQKILLPLFALESVFFSQPGPPTETLGPLKKGPNLLRSY